MRSRDAVHIAVKVSADCNVQRNDPSSDFILAAALTELYSDKFHPTLKASALTFYPVHAVFLICTDSVRRLLISSGLTIVEFLPTPFELHDPNGRLQVKLGISRETRFRRIYKCLHLMLRKVHTTFTEGITGITSHAHNMRQHRPVTSYAVNFPEAKALTAVLNGNQSMRNCHWCMGSTKHFLFNPEQGKDLQLKQTRSWWHMKYIMNRCWLRMKAKIVSFAHIWNKSDRTFF